MSGNQWLHLGPMGMGQPGTNNIAGGGGSPGGTTLSGYRSVQDARRAAAMPARTPQAEYPDGYLGNVNSRRDDKLLGHIQSRLTQRSYQRGVHKGERVDPQDYYWNDVVNPQAGLEAEAKGLKWTQVGSTPMDQINHMGKNHMLAPQDFDRIADSVGLQSPTELNPVRSAKLSRLLPTWK
jgi:hypothetical protein